MSPYVHRSPTPTPPASPPPQGPWVKINFLPRFAPLPAPELGPCLRLYNPTTRPLFTVAELGEKIPPSRWVFVVSAVGGWVGKKRGGVGKKKMGSGRKRCPGCGKWAGAFSKFFPWLVFLGVSGCCPYYSCLPDRRFFFIYINAFLQAELSCLI